MNRWLWLCPALAITLAAGVLAGWGFSWGSALLVGLLLVCPLLVLWGATAMRRLPDFPREPVPVTAGMTFGWVAPIYEWYCPKLGLGPAFRAATMRRAALRAGERMLEVGCGTGVLTRLAAEAVGTTGQAVGIDAAPAMIAVARRNAAAAASRGQFRLAAIEALPFSDASFDVALASLMLHHLPPTAKAAGLSEVRRVLRPGGRLLIADLDRPANRLWWLLFWPLLLLPMTASNLRGEIPDFLRRAGFVSVQAEGRWMGLLSWWTAVSPVVQGATP